MHRSPALNYQGPLTLVVAAASTKYSTKTTKDQPGRPHLADTVWPKRGTLIKLQPPATLSLGTHLDAECSRERI